MLFQSAQDRYDAGDFAGAAGLLRFMSEHYPSSEAVQEALVYALFLQRAGAPAADPDLSKELGEALARWTATSEVPAWADLARAQHAIDSGDPTRARAAVQRFRRDWDGQPEALEAYVREIERYLDSNG